MSVAKAVVKIHIDLFRGKWRVLCCGSKHKMPRRELFGPGGHYGAVGLNKAGVQRPGAEF